MSVYILATQHFRISKNYRANAVHVHVYAAIISLTSLVIHKIE